MNRSSRIILIALLAFSMLVLLSPGVQAVPSLGVATEFAYQGPEFDAYQDYFVQEYIVAGEELHGFAIGPSGSDLIVFTNILSSDIYLLTTEDVYQTNSPLFDGVALGLFEGTGQFNGYKPTPYYGLNLGQVDGDWYALPSDPFQPAPYYAMDVPLTYSGEILAGQYFFAVADDNGTSGLQANGGHNNGGISVFTASGNGSDSFSPATSSATGVVPEPGTLLLLGSGLLGARFYMRKRRTRGRRNR